MIHKSKLLFVNIALTLVALLIFTVVSLTAATPAVFAAGEQISLKSSAPSYVYAGGNITYELVVKNYLSQPITNIVIFDLKKEIKPAEFIQKLSENNIRATAFGKQSIRFVTHRDINSSQIDNVCQTLSELQFGLKD